MHSEPLDLTFANPFLQLLEATGLLKSGKSVVVGDNIRFPGAPQYLEYVSAAPSGGQASRKVYYKTERLMGHIEYIPEIEVRVESLVEVVRM